MYVCLRVRCRLLYPIFAKMEMYGQTFSTISEYCQTRVDVWTDWHEHRSLFDSLYVFAQKRKGKQRKEWRRSGRQARVNSRDNCIFVNVENRGREDHCPAQFPNYSGERTWVGMLNVFVLRHTVQTESPWGTRRPCLYKPAARDTGPL